MIRHAPPRCAASAICAGVALRCSSAARSPSTATDRSTRRPLWNRSASVFTSGIQVATASTVLFSMRTHGHCVMRSTINFLGQPYPDDLSTQWTSWLASRGAKKVFDKNEVGNFSRAKMSDAGAFGRAGSAHQAATCRSIMGGSREWLP
jgi:hypothetical protein